MTEQQEDKMDSSTVKKLVTIDLFNIARILPTSYTSIQFIGIIQNTKLDINN